MVTLSKQSRSVAGLLAPLAVANGITVSTLYWGQAVVARAEADFGQSAVISLMPGATLMGYAAGVAGLASIVGDLTRPRSVGWHFGLLTTALALAAAAPTPLVLTILCFVVGLGCSLTQRLLTVATSAVPADRRAPTIGWIIAAGLCGIVLARACIPAASVSLGWRWVFVLDAGLACCAGIATTIVARHVYSAQPVGHTASLPRAVSLWNGQSTLRRAALQQAVVFAAFNLGWALFPHRLGAGPWPSLCMGAVATLGAGAALVSGRACGRSNAGRVARAGFTTVVVASVALAVGQGALSVVTLAMVALDAGTQTALVANQARAQALAPTPGVRGRLAAIVTTIGFAGGAAGSALGNLLARTI